MSFLWCLRVLLFYLVVSIWTAAFLLIMIIPSHLPVLSPLSKYKMAEIYSVVFIFLSRVVCGLKYDIKGMDKLPSTPCVVACNHQSFLDNVFMQLIIPSHSWIIKKELFKIPFFGWGLRLMDPVAVDRSDGFSVKQILREGKKKIEAGLWIIIFPESTRLRPHQTKKFKPSAASLASHARVPIVMMAHNAGLFWPKGFWIKKPGVININIVSVLDAEKIQELGVRGSTDYIEKIINAEKDRLCS